MVLAFPVIAIVALVNALNAKERARQLELRVTRWKQARPRAPRRAAEPQPIIVEPPPPITANRSSKLRPPTCRRL